MGGTLSPENSRNPVRGTSAVHRTSYARTFPIVFIGGVCLVESPASPAMLREREGCGN
jgi:hypothetical protein